MVDRRQPKWTLEVDSVKKQTVIEEEEGDYESAGSKMTGKVEWTWIQY